MDNVYTLDTTSQDNPQLITIRYEEMGTVMEEQGVGYLVTMGTFTGVSKYPQAEGTAGLQFLIPYSAITSFQFEDIEGGTAN